MAIPENHSPPTPSELAGFTREGEKLIRLATKQVAQARNCAPSTFDELAVAAEAMRRWIIAVERELARVKP